MESLKAGRELDAEIAMRVMGWDSLKTTDLEGLVGMSPEMLEPDAFSVYVKVPHYSTDMSAAWEVVEKLSVAYMVSVRVYPTPYSLKLKGTEVKIYTEQGHRLVTVCEDNKDTPLVICLAALELKDMVKKYESRT